MRPVPTWKSTAAAPTSVRAGPYCAAALGEDALAVLAVAEGTADEEELAALLDQRLLVGVRVGLGRREGGVQATGQQQAQHEHDEAGERAAAVPGEATGGAVQKAHNQSLRVRVGLGIQQFFVISGAAVT